MVYVYVREYLCLTGILMLFAYCSSSYTNKGLTEVPSDIPTGTTTLDLANNNIQTFDPEKLKGLTKLIELKMPRNSLTQFVNLTYVKGTITMLDLQDNKISSIHADLMHMLTKLKELVLRGNVLTTIPDVSGPSNALQKLDLRNNKFTQFPRLSLIGKSILELLMDSNSITKIDFIDTEGLDKIKLLSLIGNSLTVFPDLSTLVDTLNKIDLTNNNINHVPENNFIFTGNYGLNDYKMTLILSRNNLTSLPPLGGTIQNTNINLLGNPLHCDAKIAWMMKVTGIKYEYYTDNEDPNDDIVEYYNSLSEATCETPAHLNGRSIQSLTLADLEIYKTKELPETVFEVSSTSSLGKDNFYSVSTKITKTQVISRLECHSLCQPQLGCYFYNLKCDNVSTACLCHYSDPFGEDILTQPNDGIGWEFYPVA